MATATRADQATEKLTIEARNGVVRIQDGEDVILVRETAYDAALARLERQAADEADENGAEAYSDLLGLCSGPRACRSGEDTGLVEEREALVAAWSDCPNDIVWPCALPRPAPRAPEPSGASGAAEWLRERETTMTTDFFASASTVTDSDAAEDAVEVSVYVRIGERQINGDVTLVPSGGTAYLALGSEPSTWISQNIVSAMTDELTDAEFRAGCEAIRAAASERAYAERG